MKKVINIIADLSFALIIIGFSFLASYFFFLWSGYPTGGDAAQHLSRFTYTLTFPDSFNWFHAWAGGMPQFLWYPRIPYILLGLIIKLAGWSPELTLTAAAVASTGLVGVGIYSLIQSLTRSRLAGLMGAVLFLATPASYTLIRASVYARQLAFPFLVFAFVFFIRFWRVYINQRFSKVDYILMVFFLGVVLLNHLVMGATVVGLIGLVAIFTARNFKMFLSGFTKVIIPPLFLSASFWLPFLFHPIPGFLAGQDVVSRTQITNAWSNLSQFFDPSYIYFFEPTPFILPFFLLGSVVIFGSIVLLRRGRLAVDKFDKRLNLVFLILAVLATLYAQITFSVLASFYSNIWPALWVLLFSAFFFSLVSGLSFAWGVSSKIMRILILIPLSILVLGWMQTQFPLDNFPKNPIFKARDYSIPADTPYERFEANRDREFYNLTASSLIPGAQQFNFRFGTGNFDHMARWFNIQYPFVPQTREYYYISVINPDSYFHLIEAVWNMADNYLETDFLLDWWGVKQFIVGEEIEKERVPGKFADKEEVYRKLGDFTYQGPLPLHQRYEGYEFLKARPILAATKTPTILVISKDKSAYTTIFRSLSYGNANSNVAIPVDGGEFIDDYKIDELRQFSAIFLFEYRWRNFSKADKLLSQYVQEGGRLIIEENKDDFPGQPFEVAPILDSIVEERKGDWRFNAREDVNLTNFDKPLYDGGAWRVIVAKSLKEGARVILTSFSKPILVSRDYGEGKVIWSGMNLPFHAVYYQNATESGFISSLLELEKPQNAPEGKNEGLTYLTPDYQVTFVNPQERRVAVIGDSGGILFKEFYFPNWHAYSVNEKKLLGNKKELKIYKVGPGFMYVFLPPNAKESSEILWRYEKSFVERLATGISTVSFVFLLLYGLEGKYFPPFLSGIRNGMTNNASRLASKFSLWWDRDDE